MNQRLSQWFPAATLAAVLSSLLSVIDVQTKALFARLQRVREVRSMGLAWWDAWQVSGVTILAGGTDPQLDELTRTVQEGLKEGFSAIEKKLDEKITATLKPVTERVEAVEREAVRFDATGKRFKWNGGEAPAILHAGVNKDSQPLMLSNIWRGAMARNLEKWAPAEIAWDQRLRELGYGGLANMSLGSILFPLGEELIPDRVDEKGNVTVSYADLRMELKQRLHITVDPGEVAWMAKRFAGFAQAALGLQRKDLQLGDDTLGGYLIPTTQADRVIDLLRNRLSVMRAGATEFPLPPTGNLTLPRLTADPAFTWTDPDTTTDSATSNIGLGVVRLQAKSVRGYVTIPNDLMRYSSPAVELLVRSALASKEAIAEDSAFLEGAGSSLQPKGVINYPASAAEVPANGKVTLHVAKTVGANGNTFEPEDVMQIMALYYMGNDPDPPTAWIKRPLLWAAIANRRADAITAADGKGPFMFWTTRGGAGDQVPERLGGTPVVQTIQLSNNRVKGSGTTLVYSLFGNFRRMLIGRVGVIELAVSEHVKFLQDKTIIRCVGRVDSGLEHEESFVLTDSLLES